MEGRYNRQDTPEAGETMIDFDDILSIGEEVSLISVASAQAMDRYRASNKAFMLAIKVFDEFNFPWWGFMPLIGYRQRNAYNRLYRVAKYLYRRRQEILMRGE